MFHKAVDGGATDRRAEAFTAELDALLAFYAPDVVCHPAPGWVPEELCHGHAGIRRLAGVWSESVTAPALEFHDVRDLGDRMLVLARLTGRELTTRRPIERPFALLNSDLREDGTVGEVRFFLGWAEALAEAGLAEPAPAPGSAR
jgi:hypothetical protein